MEKITDSKEKETLNKNFVEAYKSAFQKEPVGLENWQIAKKILEVLDNPDWVPNSLAQDCIYEIVQGGLIYPNEEIKLKTILAAEESAPRIFPGLKNITDVHMDQIEAEYRKKMKHY